MNIDQLRKKKRRILQIAESFGAENIMVFGSTARNESDDASDIDFLVEMKKGSTLLNRIGLKLALEKYLKKDVDVVSAKSLKGRLYENIRKDAILL
jgi:predicted nucleotidyltransferase